MTSKVRDQRPPMLREAYNDDACHDFIVYDLGFQIPLVYRYAEGIHEVQKRLIVRYGDENIARAMGVFREVLEVDDASGLGDDGDMWRSWRHDHKHRRVSCSSIILNQRVAMDEADAVKEDLSNPGTPRFPGMILPTPIARPRRTNGLSAATDQSQQTPRSDQDQDDTGGAHVGLGAIEAGDRGRYIPSVPLSQPSEAAWLAQTYGGAPKDYEGAFEERVNRINNSQNVSTTAGKPDNRPMRKQSMRKMVAKRVSSLFNKDGKEDRATDRAKGRAGGPLKESRESARNRRPQIPPLSFDGVRDESDCDNTSCMDTAHPDRRSFHVAGPANATDSLHILHSDKLKDVLPSLQYLTQESPISTLSSDTPSLIFSENSITHPSTISTSSSNTNCPTASSRHAFRSITRDLILPTTSETPSEVPITPLLLDPEKFDPGKCDNSPRLEKR